MLLTSFRKNRKELTSDNVVIKGKDIDKLAVYKAKAQFDN